MRKIVLRRALPCSLKSGLLYTIILSADLFGRRELKSDKLISVQICQINQISDKHQTKQLFYHSRPLKKVASEIHETSDGVRLSGSSIASELGGRNQVT